MIVVTQSYFCKVSSNASGSISNDTLYSKDESAPAGGDEDLDLDLDWCESSSSSSSSRSDGVRPSCKEGIDLAGGGSLTWT